MNCEGMIFLSNLNYGDMICSRTVVLFISDSAICVDGLMPQTQLIIMFCQELTN